MPFSIRGPFILVGIITGLVVICVCAPTENETPQDLPDNCTHTLRRSSQLSRYFDLTFLRKFFSHWNPFTGKMRVKMQFFLYKRHFPDCGREIIAHDDDTLALSGFNATHPTRIIIHGWMSQSKGKFNRAVKGAYLSLASQRANSTKVVNPDKHNSDDDIEVAGESAAHTDFNVVVVDWSVISSNINYFGVVDLIEDLGFLLAEFIRYLHIRAGLQFDDVYLIGHSLGAQIAGSAGKQVKPFLFNTIFALDPAGPKFRDLSAEFRIDLTDAFYVESIQTSSSLGFAEPLGHATFYPNYGHAQKKCYIYGCSHKRAYNYFAESITSTQGFWGMHCQRQSEDVWIISDSGKEFRMGGEPSTPKNGTFYVKTNDRPPFARGRRKLRSMWEEAIF